MNMEEAVSALAKRLPTLRFQGFAASNGIDMRSAIPSQAFVKATVSRVESPMLAYTWMLRICTAATKDAG